MPISGEDDIMNALKTTLEGITLTNGYQTDVAEVLETAAVIADIANKPGIRFYSPDQTRINHSFARSQKSIHIFIWAYVEAQPFDWDPLRKIKADIEKALSTASAWTHREFTEMSDFRDHFGGHEQMIGITEVELTVSYRYLFASP